VPVLTSGRSRTAPACLGWEVAAVTGDRTPASQRDRPPGSLPDEQERTAGDTMTICVSRYHGPRLVLDL